MLLSLFVKVTSSFSSGQWVPVWLTGSISIVDAVTLGRRKGRRLKRKSIVAAIGYLELQNRDSSVPIKGRRFDSVRWFRPLQIFIGTMKTY